MRRKIGECLVQAGLITEEELQIALAEHKRSGERIGAVLVRLAFATEKQVAKALAFQLGFPYANLAEEPPEPDAIVLIPRAVALKRACVAVRLEKNLLTVAMSDPLLFSLVQDLEFQTGHRIQQVVATRTEIQEAIERGYPENALSSAGVPGAAAGIVPPAPPVVRNGRRRDDGADPVSGLAPHDVVRVVEPPIPHRGGPDAGQGAPITDLVNLLVNGAVTSRASDIHIEPQEEGVLVRHRIDGQLKEVMDLPKWVHEGLVARIKGMADMDVAEKRVPQDGRLRITKEDGPAVEFRVSTLPTLHGEKMVVRVLDHGRAAPPLEELGLSAAALEEIRHCLRQPHGMLLVVGPTGSGRTTTLSSAISAIQTTRTNVITIEDPIEYRIPGVNQTEVNERAQLTCASALRTILRQDPDVVLVGEIRDQETARLVMQAAQVGQLVLSSLRADDAPSAMTRLRDMGLEPYVTGSALIGVVAQRLVRRLCESCRRQYAPDSETLRALNVSEPEASPFAVYRAVGCDDCNNIGYRGRIAIYEVMRITEKLRRLIAQDVGEDILRDAAIGAGMTTLDEDGLAKVKAGLTTPEELLRVLTEAREMRTSRRGCGKCGGALQADWQFCPYCGSGQQARSSTRRRQEGRGEAPGSNVAEFKNHSR